jgi:hypothetical protein
MVPRSLSAQSTPRSLAAMFTQKKAPGTSVRTAPVARLRLRRPTPSSAQKRYLALSAVAKGPVLLGGSHRIR